MAGRAGEDLRASPGGAAGPSVAAGPGLTHTEIARKLVHIGAGGVAFLLRWLGPVGAAACAAAALLFNALVLPRAGGRRLWREAESRRGAAPGIVLYPLSVLLLVLVFPGRLEVAAAVWGILAFGDGLAALAGGAWGGRRLPWNPAKSWAGSAAFVGAGAVAAAALLLWTAPGRYAPAFAVAVAAATAVVAALVESLPLRLDDNLTVPPLAGLVLFCLLLTEGRWGGWLAGEGASRLLAGLVVNAAFAGVAWAIRGLDRAGALAGLVIGTALWAGLGWRGWLLLAAFFALGTGGTWLGYGRKAAARLAQGDGGRRSARHAIANGGVAAAAAVLAATTAFPDAFALACAGALAAAAADTVSSEIGQLAGGRTFLVTTLRPVPPGSEGGISAAGTLAGLAAAGVMAALGAVAGLHGWSVAAVVALAGVLGSVADSLLGATLEVRGLLDNEAVNFLGTLAAALLAGGLAALSA